MKKILIILAAVAVIIGGAVYYRLSSLQEYENLQTQTGNSGGNLYNEGLFCEYNGIIYFANPSDDFKLYSMPALGGKATKLGDDSVRYINVDDNNIYYAKGSSISNDTSGGNYMFENMNFNNNVICRVSHSGKHKKYMQNAPALYVCLIGNELYYMHYDNSQGSSLYRIDINGDNDEQVTSEMIRSCTSYQGVLYYNGVTADHNIYAYDTISGGTSVVLEGNYWMPVYSDGYLFYLDLDRNYALCRYNLSTGEEITIVPSSVELYNVYGNTVYYQTFDTDDVGLYSVNYDGTGRSLIMSGTFCNISVTSSYVFFRRYGEETFYYFPSNSPGSVNVFVPEM